MANNQLTPPLSKKQAKEFAKLDRRDQELYLRVRLHDEVEVWLQYFLDAGIESDRLRATYLLRPPQR